MKENKVVRYLFTVSNIDLNRLWELSDVGFFTKEELKEFYYLNGASQSLIDDIEAFN